MLAAAENGAADRADIVVVTAPGECHVLDRYDEIVGRVDVYPSLARRPHGKPGVRGVGADELLPARRRPGVKIPADIARRQSQRPQAGDLQMREVLTDAATRLKYLF